MTRSQTFATIAVLIAVGVVSRIVPHTPNFAPVTATGLFCGAHLRGRYTGLVPLAVMLISDYLLLYVNPYGETRLNVIHAPWDLYHATLPYVYASLGISTLVGRQLRGDSRPVAVTAGALFCSVQFFLISNAAVWIEGAYDRGIAGLWQSYVAGIPFFKGTLAGDLFYTAAFFGLFEIARQRGWASARFESKSAG
jgi:hypothetical protein